MSYQNFRLRPPADVQPSEHHKGRCYYRFAQPTLCCIFPQSKGYRSNSTSVLPCFFPRLSGGSIAFARVLYRQTTCWGHNISGRYPPRRNTILHSYVVPNFTTSTDINLPLKGPVSLSPSWTDGGDVAPPRGFILDCLHGLFTGEISLDGVCVAFHGMTCFIPDAQLQLLLENLSVLKLRSSWKMFWLLSRMSEQEVCFCPLSKPHNLIYNGRVRSSSEEGFLLGQHLTL